MTQSLVTGLGVVSCLGTGVEPFWRALCAATSTPGRIEDPHGNYACSVYHVVGPAAEPAGLAEPADVGGSRLGRTSRFAVEAARQALADAGLDELPADRVAVLVATGMGDADLPERRAGGVPTDRPPPVFALAAAVADQLGCQGGASVVSNACAASGYAFGIAADMIAAGEADVVVAGGADSYSRVALAAFNRLGAIDPVRCRPFDAGRHGTVFGEGAGMLVLESERHARGRGARVYGRLAGVGWSCDGDHLTAPEPAGTQIRRAMALALADAGLAAGSVGAVLPHGTGTELNDVVESQALQAVLGTDRGTPLYSLKAMVGHTGGAAAALAAVAGTLILDRRSVPPNVPLDRQDPQCPVWLPQGAAVPLPAPAVLVNAYAFGGMNASLVLAEAS
jgi:3-oxoacyl-(acyl-carrier-protein) synthase